MDEREGDSKLGRLEKGTWVVGRIDPRKMGKYQYAPHSFRAQLGIPQINKMPLLITIK